MNGRRETEKVRTSQRVQIDWDQIDWSQVKHQVENNQQKIFRDAQMGIFWKTKQYQKLLVRSLSARLLAVKLVTEINAGRNTPGIDGKIIRTGKAKIALAEDLKIRNYKPDPVKVRWIPKSDGNRRKLGIPTIRDRVMQALILLAMEPEWEARFEPHSFGFRPGRSAIDAVSHIANTLIQRKGCRPHSGWVFDADITKCFDNIDHGALLVKLQGSPFLAVVKKWLKSGLISKIGFERQRKGILKGVLLAHF